MTPAVDPPKEPTEVPTTAPTEPSGTSIADQLKAVGNGAKPAIDLSQIEGTTPDFTGIGRAIPDSSFPPLRARLTEHLDAGDRAPYVDRVQRSLDADQPSENGRLDMPTSFGRVTIDVGIDIATSLENAGQELIDSAARIRTKREPEKSEGKNISGELEADVVRQHPLELQGFATAAARPEAPEGELKLAEEIRRTFLYAALKIVEEVPNTSARRVALESLQTAKMWAVQAVFDF